MRWPFTLLLFICAGAAHAHGPDEEHESRYREGDAAAWDRPLRDTELYDPARRDVYNFIDETKVRHLRPLLLARCNIVGDAAHELDVDHRVERV